MTGNRKWGWLLVVLAVSLFIHTPALKAQSTTQTIQGLVSDATGAVIPGATVSYMNLDTGVSQSGAIQRDRELHVCVGSRRQL